MIGTAGGDLYLGIDIGTRKTAAVVTNGHEALPAAATVIHEADIPSPPGRSEQDVRLLLESCRIAVRRIPRDLRRGIRGIGVTGQMHSVVLLDRHNNPVSPLISWQDKRCLEGGILETLNAGIEKPLRAGFGCATIAWYSHVGKMPPQAAHASTVQDLAVAQLCGLSRPITDPTNAASWGLFDLHRLRWDEEAAAAAGVPVGFLPEVVADGQVAGHLTQRQAEILDIPAGIPVVTAIGDNQASIVATIQDSQKELSLTIGTGAQLSAVLANDTRTTLQNAYPSIEYRPYFHGAVLAVAAILSGGSAWQWLATAIQQWMTALGVTAIPIQRIYDTMNEAGLADSSQGLIISPNLLGERYDATLRGCIRGISLDNFTLGSVARALARGICTGLRRMLPDELLAGRTRIMGSGNGLVQNPLLRLAAEEVFGLPVVMSSLSEAAAVGAARNACAALSRRT